MSDLVEEIVNIPEEQPVETPEQPVETKTEVVAEQKKPEEKKEEHVPAGLYAATRKRAVEAERQLNEARTQLEQLAEMRKQLEELRNPKPVVPSMEDDPIGHISHEQRSQFKALNDKMEQITGDLTQRQKAEQQAMSVQRNVSAIAQQEQAFVAESPDYYDALNYVREVQRNNMIDMGVEPEMIERLLPQQEYNTALQALQIGQNPAKLVYNMAKRFGYRKAEPQKEVSQQTMDNLSQFEKAQQAAKSLKSNSLPETPVEDTGEGFSEFDLARKELGFR